MAFLGFGAAGILCSILVSNRNPAQQSYYSRDKDPGLMAEEKLPETINVFELPSNLSLGQFRQLKPNADCKAIRVRVPYGTSSIKLENLPEINSQLCEIERPPVRDGFADTSSGIRGYFIDDPYFPDFKGQLLYLQNKPIEDLSLEPLIRKLKSIYHSHPNIKRDLVYGSVPIQMFEFPVNLRGGLHRLRVMASDYREEEIDAVIAIYFDNLPAIDFILKTAGNQASQEAQKRIDDFLK